MLCFDRSVYKTLAMLFDCRKERYGDLPSYTNLSKIILVKDVQLETDAAKSNTNDTGKLVERVKDGIESFLKTAYGWQGGLPYLSRTVHYARSRSCYQFTI